MKCVIEKLCKVYNTHRKSIVDFPTIKFDLFKSETIRKEFFLASYKITHIKSLICGTNRQSLLWIVDGSIVIIKISIWSGHAFVNCYVN